MSDAVVGDPNSLRYDHTARMARLAAYAQSRGIGVIDTEDRLPPDDKALWDEIAKRLVQYRDAMDDGTDDVDFPDGWESV